MPGLILVVEDEESIFGVIKGLLEAEDYKVMISPSLFHARGALAKAAPDLVILDRRLPDGDGIELCREMRAKDEWRDVPILFLSLKQKPKDKVAGLDVGADDYLAKPFDDQELLARVAALFRRRGSQGAPSVILQSGELRLDATRIQAFLNEQPIALSAKEFELLRVFMGSKGRVLSRETLLQAVWGYDKQLEITSKTVDVTISRLRKKLGDYGEKISFVKGYGYRFDEA